jgi:CRP-like cAMP-binding protein
MVSPTWRGEDLLVQLGSAIEPLLTAHTVMVVFGACEPHLLSCYCRFQRPCGSRNINSTEAGYLIPLVRSPLTCDPAEYQREVQAALAALAAPVFKGFTAEEIEGCTARNVFVVLSGALEVSDQGHPIAVLLPGDVFGEAAYLLEGARTFDVDVLSDDTRILSLSERSLRQLTATDPAVAAKLLGNISKILCRRLANGWHAVDAAARL